MSMGVKIEEKLSDVKMEAGGEKRDGDSSVCVVYVFV